VTAGLAVVAGGLTACNNDREECLRKSEGDFSFYFNPRLPSPPDSTANIKYTISNAVLLEIKQFPGNVPPVIVYTFDVPNTSVNRDLNLYDLGRTLPLVEDSTYTITVDMTQRLNPPAMGLKIFDGSGLLFLGVNDWRPAGEDGAQVFTSGYGDLGSDGNLEVFFVNDGCDPRVENSECFQQIRNYRMDFRLGTRNPLSLWNRDTGQSGSWIFHVHKSERVVAKTACGLLDQNGVSFTAERAGAR
jgi:hypothetical protein